ncbi:MAG: hypothetical protein ACREK5_11570 [Gemmatimonadota bacterium]
MSSGPTVDALEVIETRPSLRPMVRAHPSRLDQRSTGSGSGLKGRARPALDVPVHLEEAPPSRFIPFHPVHSFERARALWLEGHRLADFRRRNDPFLAGGDECWPFPDEELDTNPNL